MKVRRPLTILLALLLAVPVVTLAPPVRALQAVSEQDLTRAREKIAAARERVDAARGELSREQRQLRDAERAMADAARAVRDIRTRERKAQQRIDALTAERAKLQREAEAQRAALARDVRDAWLLGRRQQLRLWLSADDPQQAARMTRYYDYLHRDRAARLGRFETARAAAAARQVELEQEQAHLAKAREELAAGETEKRRAGEARRRAVAALQDELRDRSNELKRLQEDEAALKRTFDAVREAFRDIAPEAVGAPLSTRRGKLRWPATGRVVSSFGAPLAEGKLRANGIVVAAAEGSDVRAVHAGRVAYADWLRGYGLLVIIDHGNDHLTVYGYNQSLRRSIGEWVGEGDTIATVGASGGRTSPGLYFEIRVGGDAQDPARWLRRP